MFLALYKTMVRPHLEYASAVWAPRYKKDQIAIENVQRRATRMVRELAGLSYIERNRKCGLPTLEYRRQRADMIQVFKFVHKLDFVSADLFDIRDTRRGHKYKFFKRRFRTSARQNVFSNRVVDTWNSLPEYVVDAPSIDSFKRRINKLWVGPYKFEARCYLPG